MEATVESLCNQLARARLLDADAIRGLRGRWRSEGGAAVDNVQEFLSPNFHQPLPFKYLFLLLIAILARSRPPVNWIELILILTFTYMALYSVRYITLFVIITAPILIRLIDQMKLELPTKVNTFLEERTPVPP